ncbi:polysaccharide deacetylase family protein [Solwaraspora sp. WMMD1047]|uniref:polysaccharide deacetylase family protein n=1 Tax=Solwaraspora sp. WMMD1047 TaxID=3016102 RepID=UPI002417DBE3|nr:polysaccharide deacetylase family protein [Solwaraspora sp. WMMD1047]MDG4833674.1 polysaccharide deacetylase family protein [Solwaraspora sp. WMMD1047]
MTASPSTRTLAVIAAVAVASLAAIYLLGRAVGGPTGPSLLTGVPAATPSAADEPAGPHDVAGPTTPTGTPTASSPAAAPTLDPHAEAEQPRLPAEPGGGPYGSRRTTGSPAVALTFDDGPDPNYTPQALAMLRSYRVQATFCLVGANVAKYPHLVRAIAADGHTLCNHSWSHDLALGSRSRSVIVADLVRTNEALRAAVPGARIAYFRQPGGNWTASVVTVAAQLGMTSLHWTVDPQDWRRPGVSSIATAVTSSTVPGAIVLLHDAGGNRQGTVSALRSILPNLTRRFALTALPTGGGVTAGSGAGAGPAQALPGPGPTPRSAARLPATVAG